MDAQAEPQTTAPRHVGALKVALAALRPLPLQSDRLPDAFRRLLERMPDELPLPGSGQTLRRWHALATVAAADLALLKLYEGHTDAIAILEELGVTAAAGTWGVWAAESPNAVATFHGDDTAGRLDGCKAWCSGAGVLDHALVTARTPGGARVLVQVALKQAGVHHDHAGWNAVGMAATHTGNVEFENVCASLVGAPDAYVRRPGFWHGAAGIAACWYGASCSVAMTLRRSPRVTRDAHAKAHLGAVDARLFAARCVIEETARAIDAAATADAHMHALRVRAVVEAAAAETLDRVGRALGVGPLCADAEHAQRCADLTTFLRQSHAESDLQALGEFAMHNDAGDLL